MQRILIIEDNPQFREGASRYFSIRSDVQAGYATNYDEAMREIYSEPRFDGAVIDCFFPKVTGSGDLTLGYEVIQQMVRTDPRGRKKSPVARALTQVGDLLGREFAKSAADNANVKYSAELDNYWAIEQAMQESEANQPLGILIAEKAEELGIPLILATSSYHHDELTQPIQEYASRRRWRLIDCISGKENEKATPCFWERAFGELERMLRD